MKPDLKTWLAIGFIVLIAGGAFFLGYRTGQPKQIRENVAVNVNYGEMHGLWLKTVPKRESLITVSQWFPGKPYPVHDTVYTDSGSVQTWTADTTITVPIMTEVRQGDSTKTVKDSTKAKLKVTFVGKPYNQLYLNLLRTNPVRLNIPVMIKEVTKREYPFFTLEGLTGVSIGSGVGFGVKATFDRFGIAYIAQSNSKPWLYVSYSVVGF